MRAPKHGTTKVSGAELTVVPTTNEARPGHSPSKAPHDEDCFCCCAHVVPAQTHSLAAVPIAALLPDARLDIAVPSPPLTTAYRPPRFV